MSNIRKRSFTNYQTSAELEQQLLDQVIEQKNHETLFNQNPEFQKTQQSISLGLFKSKKAKIFTKFQKYHHKTARNFHQNANVSTIQSLKKQIIALQCDQIKSYRLSSIRAEEKDEQKPKQNQNVSEIQAMIIKYRNLKKQTMADKFRSKFIVFKNNKMMVQSKTARSSIKNDQLSTKSDRFLIRKQKAGQVQSSGQKVIERRAEYFSAKSKNTLSLTARRFYDKKNSNTRTKTQTSLGIYERQKSIKRLRLQDRVFSRSILSL